MIYTAQPKLSITTKLDGIRSWSLEAIATCPGSMYMGALVPACDGCYATLGNYTFPAVKAARAHNLQDWQTTDWVDAMVQELDADRYFRWFDSGDMYSVKLAEKMYLVMLRTPWCKHWLPTRMHKFEKFSKVLERMQALPNVMVRASADGIDGSFEPWHGSTIVAHADDVTDDHVACNAYKHGGKCSGCRACWNKEVPMIAYVAHGNKMKGVIKIYAAA